MTISVGEVGAAINVAGTETRLVSRLGVVCIRRLALLLREVDVVRWGTGLGVLFRGPLLVDMLWSFT